ncbi:MAG: FUSC family protein [Phycisphaeraceae bacterium]|nr:FUSC family protein [Phycisphaeraceae bacterium]
MAGLAELRRLETWTRELSATPDRVRTALRTTIACTAATLVTQSLHLDQGFWAVITILVLAPPTVAASIRKATFRLLGTASGCMIAVGSVALFAQQPPLQMAAVFLTLAVALYFATGRVAPYSYFCAAFTTSIVFYAAVQDPARAGDFAWARFKEISLGVLISGASHMLIWPVHADRTLREGVARKIEQAVALLDALRETAPTMTEAEIIAPPPSSERMAAQLDLLDTAAGLHERVYEHRHAWEAVIGVVEAVRLACNECARLSLAAGAREGLAPLRHELTAALDALSMQARECAAALRTERVVNLSATSPFEGLDGALARQRAPGHGVPWKPDQLAAAAATVEALRSAWSLLGRLGPESNAALGHAAPSAASVIVQPLQPPSLLPLDDSRVRWAIKGALAASVAILLGASLRWSMGVPATATCVVLAVTGSLGALVQKSGLRLLGTLVGGILALMILMFVMPIAEGPAALVTIAALIFFPCAWLLAGSDRVSYLGLQAAFAFCFGALGPLEPSIDLWTPTSRILGVIVGLLITGVVFTLLWPVYATTQFRESAAKTLGIIRNILNDALNLQFTQTLVSLPRQRALYDALAATTRVLAEAEYEDPAGKHLDRTAAVDLLTTLRLLTRSAILWRQAQLAAGAHFPSSASTKALASAGEALVEHIDRLARAIAVGAAPSDEPATEAAIHALNAAITTDSESLQGQGWSITQVDALFACVEHARALHALLLRGEQLARALRITRATGLAYASPTR